MFTVSSASKLKSKIQKPSQFGKKESSSKLPRGISCRWARYVYLRVNSARDSAHNFRRSMQAGAFLVRSSCRGAAADARIPVQWMRADGESHFKVYIGCGL